MTNHYETLGLKSTATRDEIKKAFGKLSLKFHPDNNDGDQYFSEMFKNIQESYEVLININKKVTYDRESQERQVSLREDNINGLSPKILNFESDKSSFEEGESIRLSWETINVDKVIIKPFGIVEKSGTKVFKLKNFDKENLSITLQAKNNLHDETITKTIKLKNNVEEFDFSTIEQDEKVDSTVISKKKVEEPASIKEEAKIHTNSFAASTSSHSVEKIESFGSSEGRIRRSTYFWRSILLGIPGYLMYYAIINSYSESSIIILGLILIVIAYLGWIQTVKRLHDLNQSGWLSLLQLIPLVNFVFGLYILFSGGTKGSNKFGPDPKKR